MFCFLLVESFAEIQNRLKLSLSIVIEFCEFRPSTSRGRLDH